MGVIYVPYIIPYSWISFVEAETLTMIYRAGWVIVPISLAFLCIARGQKDANRWGNPPGFPRWCTRRAKSSSEPAVHSDSVDQDEALLLAEPQVL